MKKKITNEDIGEIICKIAEKVRAEIDFDFRVAKSQMCLAENDLVDSLNDEQKKLYMIFKEKRDIFYEIAKEIYTKKF